MLDALTDQNLEPNHAHVVGDELAALFRLTDVTGTVLKGIAGTVAPVGGETVFDIRLPASLVATSWPGGVTVTHIDVNNATATDGSDNETWKMTKGYAIGDIVEAFLWETDGVYVDRNLDARSWARV